MNATELCPINYILYFVHCIIKTCSWYLLRKVAQKNSGRTFTSTEFTILVLENLYLMHLQ